MRRVLKVVAWILAVVLLVALGTTGAARFIAGRKYSQRWTTHETSFPIPFPLSAADLETLRLERLAAGAPPADPLAGVDLDAAALTRAIARGQHLVKTRVACEGCHGPDLGGKVVIDQALVGYWAAPNLTNALEGLRADDRHRNQGPMGVPAGRGAFGAGQSLSG